MDIWLQAYDLITKEQRYEIMDNILIKIEEVGFSNFGLGLPGNLIPEIHSDYTSQIPRWVCSQSDETIEEWEHYRNALKASLFEQTLKWMKKFDTDGSEWTSILKKILSLKEYQMHISGNEFNKGSCATGVLKGKPVDELENQ